MPQQPPNTAAISHHPFGVPTTSAGTFPQQLRFPGRPQQLQQQQQQPPPPPHPQPSFSSPFCYDLIIPDTPVKSRVETQITLKLILNPPPPGITKLHLPTQTISKPKLQAKPTPQRSANMLELSVSVLCTSAMQQPELRERALQRAMNNPPRHLPPENDEDENSPQNGAEVRICGGCMTRERKRAARKRVKNQEDENAWLKDEEHRVIVFNTQEVKDWECCGEMDTIPGALKVELPLRIACYCRHHGEKMGFNIIFTLKDHQQRPIAQVLSRPIMITDDHKTHPIASMAAQPEHAMEMNGYVPPPLAGPSQLPPHSGQDLTNGNTSKTSTPGRTPPSGNGTTRPSRTLSRPASPSLGGPAKKRKSSSTSSRVPNSLTMTKMETLSPSPHPNHTPGAASPFSANSASFVTPDAMFAQPNGTSQFATNPPTPGVSEPPPFFVSNRSASIENFTMPSQLYSAPTSNHPSRAPSPNSIMNSMHTTQNNLSQTITGHGVVTLPVGGNQSAPNPVINKIIPAEGPMVGGVEVTLLGREFWNGMVVYFGPYRAQTTTFWSDCSVVCLLPPSQAAGLVPVTCDRPTNLDWSNTRAVFKYYDDSEAQLMRLAISCIGSKMNGKDLDISQVARQILEKHMGSSGQAGEQSSSGGPMFNHAATSEKLEMQLLKCLDFIDLDDSPYQADLDLKSATGHTMLHLSSSLGYRRLVAALLARGANPNELDNGHCTPLHLASIHDQPEIARRLMLAGANPNIRSLSGLTPLEVSQSGPVNRAIRFSEPRARSQTRELSHSRTSSASSLRSLPSFQPMSRVSTNDEQAAVDDGEESLEYTSGDFEDEDPDEDTYLHVRRPSMLRGDQENHGSVIRPRRELDPNSSTPNALAAALKDQIQQQLNQFQQSMALHLQNLPHLPQMPQIPTLPGMPFADYQGYLQQAPFMRRMTQYMPGMSGNRPESQHSPDTKIDHRWWDLSSFMSNNSVPPPSYEEIFPGKDTDAKQASAAQAAAEAEADAKCATLYDQESTMSETESNTEVPSVLKIGRKNAITREQQEQFLRAREQKLKMLGNDRNLFFIWIPLLLLMVCAMLYSYFPSLFILIGSFAWALMRSAWRAATNAFSRAENRASERVVEL